MSTPNNGPFIIGFGHRRRVGKDTLAGMARDRLRDAGVNVFRDAFAWKLKETARQLFGYAGLLDGDAYDREPELRETPLAALGLSPRDLWIAYGNKMREIAPDVWIRNVLDNPAYTPDAVLLVSDLRYPNEVEAIRERGGLVVKVVRDAVPASDDVADNALAGMHDAEWDRIVRNNWTVEALGRQAEWLAALIRSRLFMRQSVQNRMETL